MQQATHRALTMVPLAALLLVGCGGSNGGGAAPDAAVDLIEGPDLAHPIGPAGTFYRDITIDTVDRTWELVVPASAVAAMAAGPVPVLIGLHGAGGSADQFISSYGIDSMADQHAFVLAAPDGYNTAWYVGKDEGWPGTDGQRDGLQNDVHLVQAILGAVGAEYRVDPGRVYACGVSRGGAFTGILAAFSNDPHRLGGKYQSPFAGYAISAGFNAYNLGVSELAASSPKRPLWIMHGDQDSVVPFSDGKSFADNLTSAGWPVTFTTVAGANHAWLWQDKYGHSLDDLWNYFNTLPPQ